MSQLQIGANLAARRRARGLTQEQLAARLGVSAPAVSKWETNSSYPDITLLCPLARALRCRVDELLQFTPALTEAEAIDHLNEILHTALTGDLTAAEAALTALVQEYPDCAALQYQAAIGWSAFQVFFPTADTEARARWQRSAVELWQALHAGPDPALAQYAANQLASHAIAAGELDEAERYLQELPEQVVDASLNRYQLQLKRGDPDAARATLQKRLYAVVSQSITLLSALDSPAVLPEPERRLVLADAFRQMAATFGLLDSSGLLRVEPLLALGRVEDAAAALEEYVAVLTGPLPQPNPALFAPTLAMRDGAMSDDPDLGALRRMLRRQLLEEPAYAALRENPRAMAALERLGS